MTAALCIGAIQADDIKTYVPTPEIKQAQKEFADARFGIFLHWKIISHSMGAAFAKGLLEALLQFANENNLEHRIAVEIDLAPYPGEL